MILSKDFYLQSWPSLVRFYSTTEVKQSTDNGAKVIEGAGKGNADKLNEAFHSSARWFGTMGGTDYDVDKAGFVALMVESPADGGQLKAEITDIQIDGTVAVVTVKEEGFWGTLSFTDYFTLSVLEGRWQITNKTFAHTGGEHA